MSIPSKEGCQDHANLSACPGIQLSLSDLPCDAHKLSQYVVCAFISYVSVLSSLLDANALRTGPHFKILGNSLVVQQLRIRLPMQGTWVRALLREDPTCRRATKPVHHNY